MARSSRDECGCFSSRRSTLDPVVFFSLYFRTSSVCQIILAVDRRPNGIPVAALNQFGTQVPLYKNRRFHYHGSSPRPVSVQPRGDYRFILVMPAPVNVDIEAGLISEERIRGATLGALTVLLCTARRSSLMNGDCYQMMAYTASAVL